MAEATRPASTIEVVLANSKSLVKSAGRSLFRRVQRDTKRVADEYHGGHWARVQAQKEWEAHTALEQFLVGKDARVILARVDGKPTWIPKCDYYRYRIGALSALISARLGSASEIVELGCGVGYNILSLSLFLPDTRFIGLDVSSNGIDAAKQIVQHFGISHRFMFDVADLTESDPRTLNLLRGRDCFTYFCLEQIPHDIETVVRNILRAGPRRVLHVEPSVELLRATRPADWSNYAYVRSVDYQSRLFSTLETMHAQGELRLLETGRAAFAPTLQNDGFIALWEPLSNAHSPRG